MLKLFKLNREAKRLGFSDVGDQLRSLQSQIASLRISNQGLRERNTRLTGERDALKAKVDRMTGGLKQNRKKATTDLPIAA